MQPWPGGGQPPQGQTQSSMMRASHADRERAIDVLKAGFTEGRLSQEEYEQRLTRAHHAQTYGQLQALVVDLPQGPVASSGYAYPVRQQVAPTFWAAPPPPPPTNGLATGSMVCGVLTPVTWGLTAIPAVVLGHKARAEMRRTGETGEGYATAGLVLGYLALAVGLLVIIGVTVAALSV
ncbi:DUF1707 and DUF4190 domain-containing protein [Streptomyces sp. NPDC048639]|uniref:DUF1707 and DUF4190 domain-containing protein n=1 Tax=Streptomyces sp. NPDC048639 TaxID=3365581 RepID=UPI0037154634